MNAVREDNLALASQARRLFIWRLIALAWAVNIFWMSTERFGGDHSRSLITGMLDLFHLSLSARTVGVLNTLLRKLAHLTEYSAFSFLLYRSVEGRDRIRWRPQVANWTVVGAAAYSLTDELHQAFVRGRTASLLDCAIDALGAAMAMLFVYGISAMVETRSRRSAA